MPDLSIYTFQGSVQAGDGLYIQRQADDKLLSLCRNRQFAYVLAARQVGKSSLMNNTINRLKEHGFRSINIYIPELGVNVTPEQWYIGLIIQIDEQLELKADVMKWWQDNDHMNMPHRLSRFFREVLLAEIKGPIIIFFDEIDATLSLGPFTDDFFGMIRYLYEARANVPEFHRLSFVLIGVATPGDLIRDSHRTPFNIGEHVELTDFTFDEVLPLADGFGLRTEDARKVLAWALRWTGGHPYLTQRLCREIAVRGRAQWTEKEVEEVVRVTFLGEMSEKDNNLLFVRDMLTRRAPDVLKTLLTYREIRQGKRLVKDEEQSVIKSHLKLSGLICRRQGALRVRNRIYKDVFGLRWVKRFLSMNNLR
jgi:predicted AAA+ superfamily ATPase